MRCGSLRKWRGGRRCVTMTDCSVRLGSEALLGQLLPRAQSDIEVSQSAANDAASVCREVLQVVAGVIAYVLEAIGSS